MMHATHKMHVKKRNAQREIRKWVYSHKHSPSGASSMLSNHSCVTISSAVARILKSHFNIGSRNEHNPSASLCVKRYFSIITRLSGHGFKDLIYRSEPAESNISREYFPPILTSMGKSPRSSMICAMWSSSFEKISPWDCGSKRYSAVRSSKT